MFLISVHKLMLKKLICRTLKFGFGIEHNHTVSSGLSKFESLILVKVKAKMTLNVQKKRPFPVVNLMWMMTMKI